MTGHQEAELISRCRRGESTAWDELFDRHYGAVGRFVFQLAADFTREEVEEICQETFLTVVRKLGSFNGESQFQTWLFRVAANKARDYRDRQQAAKRGGGQVVLPLHQPEPAEGPPLDPVSASPGPDGELLHRETLELVSSAIEQLDPPCRELIQLRYFGELSYEEVGLALKLNHKTVSSRLSRCLDRLAPILKPLLSQEPTTPFSV
jgi:RNA polymerase sigma-70 factor, ECF subfamily